MGEEEQGGAALPASREPREFRRFERAWIGFMILLTIVPYLAARAWTPAGAAYTWILPPYPDDSYAYLSWVRQAMDGALLFRFKYTALPHEGFVFQPFFLLSGWICRATGLPPAVALLLLKSVGVALFFLTFFALLRWLALPRKVRITAAALTGLSSGAGGPLLWAFGDAARALRPADLDLVDLNTYWSLLWNPLFPYSLALITATILLVLRGTELAQGRPPSDGVPRCWWLAGLCLAGLLLVHPYQTPLLAAFIAIVTVRSLGRRAWRAWVPIAATAALPMVYVVWQSSAHPLLAAHAERGLMKSPTPAALLIGCGLPLIYATLALAHRGPARRRQVAGPTAACDPGAGTMRRGPESDSRCSRGGHGVTGAAIWPLALWMALGLAFAYLPVWFQRKFLFGVHVPICVLAAIGLHATCRDVRLIILAVALTIPTTLHVVATQLETCRLPSAREVYYLSDEIRDVLDALRERTRASDVVLSSYPVSRVIPAYAGNTVIWGHWAQSVDLEEQSARMRRTLDPKSALEPHERARLFWQQGAAWAVIDPQLEGRLARMDTVWLTASSEVVLQSGPYTLLRKLTEGSADTRSPDSSR